MDETSLRDQLERALTTEPPLGNLVGNSVRAGRQLRRRRRSGLVALSAAAAAVVIAVPALVSGAGQKAGKPAPAAAVPAAARTAYVAVGRDTVVPISLATNTAGTPITVPVTTLGGLGTTSAAATANGRTVYEFGITYDPGLEETVTPIDTATNTAGRTVTIPTVEPFDIAIDPDGKTAYVSANGNVFPINIATNSADARTSILGRGWTMAFTPDGKTLYVVDDFVGRDLTGAVTPIRTATNTALAPIKLTEHTDAIGYLLTIAITPDGNTAYVVDDVGGWSYANSVIPIDLASSTPLPRIRIKASGQAEGLVISPGGKTAYVLSSRSVTPIDTATNQAEPALNLPASAGYAYRIALTPDGRTIYVLAPHGVIPIRTASGTVLPMIRIADLPSFADLAITPDGKTVYVTTATGVIPISTATNKLGTVINLGGLPGQIVFGG